MVTEEYERRNAQIEALEKTIEEAKSGNETLKTQKETVYNEWIPEINHIIDVLDQNFSHFMTNMDYVGEVLLAMKEQFDFESYGIQIMVQYRSGAKLQALDRYVQSGGERAVAIADYTLSLQQLTHVPFRCVDEINQGMDPRNERKIFDMLVEETTRTGSSQYFFVTPKKEKPMHYNFGSPNIIEQTIEQQQQPARIFATAAAASPFGAPEQQQQQQQQPNIIAHAAAGFPQQQQQQQQQFQQQPSATSDDRTYSKMKNLTPEEIKAFKHPYHLHQDNYSQLEFRSTAFY